MQTAIQKKRNIAVILLVALLAFGGMNAGAGTFNAADYQAGQLASSSSTPSDGEITVAKVGKAGITLAQLKEEILHMEQAYTLSQRQLDGLGADAGAPTKFLRARQGVVTKWGTEVAAMANLVRSLALVHAAENKELSVTADEVTANVKYAKEAYENDQYDSYNKGYVESVGEDEYWDTVYPAKAKAMLTINKLYASVVAEGEEGNYPSAKTLWINFSETTLAKASIAIPESEHHSTSVEDVRSFLADVRTVDLDSLEMDDGEVSKAPDDKWVVYVKRSNGTIDEVQSSVAAHVCSSVDEEGNVSRWICDAETSKIKIAGLEDAVFYIVVDPGNPLPVFTQED